jgi:hypothetical protein
MNAKYWISLVTQTRNHGSCYVKVAHQDGETIGNVVFSWRFYGRSQQGGGHKHKAYAHRLSDGSIVRTRDLRRECSI